jgi:hypothetical protein
MDVCAHEAALGYRECNKTGSLEKKGKFPFFWMMMDVYLHRYEDDARPFWRFIVENSTGCNDPAYLEELYQYYTTAEVSLLLCMDLGFLA